MRLVYSGYHLPDLGQSFTADSAHVLALLIGMGWSYGVPNPLGTAPGTQPFVLNPRIAIPNTLPTPPLTAPWGHSTLMAYASSMLALHSYRARNWLYPPQLPARIYIASNLRMRPSGTQQLRGDASNWQDGFAMDCCVPAPILGTVGTQQIDERG